MKDIIVEFSGWARISPKDAKFDSLCEDNKTITGVEWLQLPTEDRDNYILNSVIAAQRDSIDGDYSQIDVFEDDSP
jgi:hypothetical protein